MDSGEARRREQLLTELEPYRGAEALYREGSRFCRVRVGDLEASEEALAARLDLVPTRGLDTGFPASWKIAMRWDRLESADAFWVSAYVGMKLYFEPGLVAAVVRRSEAPACEQYDRGRYDRGRYDRGRYDREQFDRIVEWIERYRKSQLARRLTGELTLLHDDRPIGMVTEYFVAEFPQVHGKFAAAEMDDESKADLGRYRRWWEDSWNEGFSEPCPTMRHFSGRWRLESADGRHTECLTPVIRFDDGTIVLRCMSGR